MIQVNELTKNYGWLKALDNVSVEINKGKVTAVLGPNGAGKTTLIKSLLGLVRPDNGQMWIDNEEVTGKSQYRNKIGYMPQEPAYPENLTVKEILDMVRDLRSQPEADDENLRKQFKLDQEMKKAFKKLSGGNKQKTSALLAFMFNPRFLFLDEPTAGLDPVSSSVLKDKINEEKQNEKTVILTSHVMSDIQELADDIIFMVEGKPWFHKTVDQLIQETGESNLERAIANIMQDKSYITDVETA